MKTLVKLNAEYTDRTGRTHRKGASVQIRSCAARRMIRRGEAEPIVERVTKPVTNATALRGEAKKAWLRQEIAAKGGEPSGTTIAALESQLRILKAMEA
jgi:hypothetical protein